MRVLCQPARLPPLLLLFLLPLCASAAEGRSGLSALRLFDPTAEGWKYNLKVGLLGTATTVGNQEDSYDTTISSASQTASVLGTLDARAVYQIGQDSDEQTLSVRYGQIQDSTSDHYTENEDEIRYDNTYRHLLVAPHFLYGAGTVETVATGPHEDDPAAVPDDYHNPFDPLQAKASVGYGQRYEQWLPDDFLEWRLGVRAQRRWGSQDLPGQDPNALGPEAYVRYESTPQPLEKSFTYFVQYEAFAEFNDMRHVTNLVTASMAYNLAKYLQLQLALRAYYESRPKEDRDEEAYSGYNKWSYKQDTLLGLTYIY